MGNGRMFGRALHSKVTSTARWAPPPNARARCIGNELAGKHGGRQAFLEASGKCKVKGS